MARPQRNTVDYFPYFCDEGEKMFYIESTYGNDGYATWIKLLRQLAIKEFHYIDLSTKPSKMFLASKCKVSVETLEAIISDLVELDFFDKNLWNKESIIWCPKFIDSIQDAYSRRSNDCVTRDQLIVYLRSLGRCKQVKCSTETKLPSGKPDINPQSRVKKSKVKKSKEESFANFWEGYPQKKNKKGAKSAWMKLTEDQIQSLRENWTRWINGYKRELSPDSTFIYCSTFLNNERWLDEFTEIKTAAPILSITSNPNR